MAERKDVVKFKGNPLTLLGQEVKVGETAPDAEVLANDLTAFKLSSFKGKVCVICTVPSLDTPVCDTQTRKFNEQAVLLGDDVVVLTVSMDLPFAQKRWCGATGSDQIQTLSDHRDAAFGEAYGVIVKGLRILTRAIFVVDAEGILQYKQIVGEITSEPNYEEALEAVKNL